MRSICFSRPPHIHKATTQPWPSGGLLLPDLRQNRMNDLQGLARNLPMFTLWGVCQDECVRMRFFWERREARPWLAANSWMSSADTVQNNVVGNLVSDECHHVLQLRWPPQSRPNTLLSHSARSPLIPQYACKSPQITPYSTSESLIVSRAPTSHQYF